MTLENFKGLVEKVAREHEEEKVFIKSYYGEEYPKLLDLRRYLMGYDKFMQLFSDEDFSEFVLTDGDIMAKSRNSDEKRRMYRENSLIGCYEFEVPNGMDGKSRIDVTRQHKPVPEDLEDILNKIGFTPSHVTDIEFFEYTHQDEFYEPTGVVKMLCNDFGFSNKDTSKMIAEEGIFWDKEKIHLIYVIGDFQGSTRYIPIYIGIGANEPFGLRLKNPRGKSRFYRLDLTREPAFEEKGRLTIKPMNIDDFVARAKEPVLTFLEETWDHKNDIIYQLMDRGEGYHPHFDDDRLKGYCKIHCDVDSEYYGTPVPKRFIGEVESGFDTTMIDREQRLKSMLESGWSNERDLMQLLDNSLREYDSFFGVHFAPERMVQRLGLRRVYEHLRDHHALDSYYLNMDNLASDLYTRMNKGIIRLRKAAMTAGMYTSLGIMEPLILSGSRV